MNNRRYLLSVATWIVLSIVVTSAPPLWLFIPAGLVWVLLFVALWLGSRDGDVE